MLAAAPERPCTDFHGVGPVANPGWGVIRERSVLAEPMDAGSPCADVGLTSGSDQTGLAEPADVGPGEPGGLVWLRRADLALGTPNVESDDQPDLHSFARGLKLDHQAVVNGLTIPWNSRVAEGNVSRLKMLKRQMYGRATFELLRKRVLLTS